MNEQHDNKNRISLIVIVNGQSVPVEGNVNAPLKVVVDQALHDSGNLGQHADQWVVRGPDGHVIDNTDLKLETFAFQDGTRISVNPKDGVGG